MGLGLRGLPLDRFNHNPELQVLDLESKIAQLNRDLSAATRDYLVLRHSGIRITTKCTANIPCGFEISLRQYLFLVYISPTYLFR